MPPKNAVFFAAAILFLIIVSPFFDIKFFIAYTKCRIKKNIKKYRKNFLFAKKIGILIMQKSKTEEKNMKCKFKKVAAAAAAGLVCGLALKKCCEKKKEKRFENNVIDIIDRMMREAELSEENFDGLGDFKMTLCYDKNSVDVFFSTGLTYDELMKLQNVAPGYKHVWQKMIDKLTAAESEWMDKLNEAGIECVSVNYVEDADDERVSNQLLFCVQNGEVKYNALNDQEEENLCVPDESDINVSI